jgi:N-acetyltransferase 10
MGYGSRALQLLKQYYSGEIPYLQSDSIRDLEPKIVDETDDFNIIDEKIEPRANLPPLLYRLTERRAEHIDYLGKNLLVI